MVLVVVVVVVVFITGTCTVNGGHWVAVSILKGQEGRRGRRVC
jgi:hypothetical protein